MAATISDKQLSYLTALVGERDLSQLREDQQAWLDANSENFETLTVGQASRVIQTLVKLPKLPKPTAIVSEAESTVPEGYFFVVDPTDNTEKFFRVAYGKVGSRWEGKVFLSVQASDYFYNVKDRSHREAVFQAILVDPVNAMNEYGIRLGRCGVCNRTLTDRDSRLRGIGPICAARLDSEPTGEEYDLLQELGLL